jgi:hypothetical protein
VIKKLPWVGLAIALLIATATVVYFGAVLIQAILRSRP